MVCLGFSDARDLICKMGSLVERGADWDVLRADRGVRW